MTPEEMIEAITSGKITNDLIESLIDFIDSFDPYGVREEYGDITKKTNRAKIRKDVKYVLKTEPQTLINELLED